MKIHHAFTSPRPLAIHLPGFRTRPTHLNGLKKVPAGLHVFSFGKLKTDAMAKRLHHGKCTVPGCDNEEKSLFSLPSSEPLKTEWLNFIYSGDVPPQIPKNVNVCGKHFKDECFHNLGQYRAGFAQNLKLKSGSTPSRAGPSATEQVSQQAAIRCILWVPVYLAN